MENYRQDFGFYCSKEPMSLMAGKILSALQPRHSDEPCMSDTLQEKQHLEILHRVTLKANEGKSRMDYWKENVLKQAETRCNHIELEGTSTPMKNYQLLNSSEVHSSDTFSTGCYDESTETELPVKIQVISGSLSPRTFSRSNIDPDHIQPLMNIPSNIEQDDGDRERQKENLLALDRNAEHLSPFSHELKRYSSEKIEMSFPELEVKRKCIYMSDGIKLWNIWSMNQEQQCRLLAETRQAKAIVLTMLFQNGSSQLCPSKDGNLLMNGILVLIKKKSDLVSTNAEIYREDNTYIHITITDNALCKKGQTQHKFLRCVLLHILQSNALVICFNAKDFLRTIYGKFMNCRKVAQSVILDPRIAAWLLNPADNNCSFEDLVRKYCATLDLAAAGNASDTQLQITCNKLTALFHLMMSLEHKLEAEGLWDLFYNIELPLITILAVMENCSIQINQEELKRTSVLLGILFEKFHLHLKCKSKLPQTNLGHLLSTAEPALNQLKDLHPLPGIVLQFRQIQKIKSTFVDGLLTYVNKSSVSPTWNQTGTVSGRLSAKHPNIQGVSKFSVEFEKQQFVHGKSKETITINPRSMFVSSKGRSFLAADFSQIELRLLAHFSADPALLKLFHETERTDVFTNLASQWKDIEYENITQADREQAKRVVYSVIYGIGKERLAECLGTTPAEANTFMECFLQKYRVSEFTQKVIQECLSKGFVISLMGRKRPLPHIHSRNYGLRAQAERQAVNFVIQGSAADLCKLAMIKISASVASSFYLTARLIAQIHDELLFEVEDSQLQEFAELVKYVMESLQHADGVQLQVPLKVSLTSGKSWGCMTELRVK